MKIFLLSVKSIDLELSFGTDYTDYTVMGDAGNYVNL